MRRPLGNRRAAVADIAFPAEPLRPSQPRVRPGSPAELGALNALLCRALGAFAGGKPAHVFTTLGRHRALFRAWLRFAGRLMPFGTLPRADTELMILRVAVNCGNDYEWRHHAAIAQRAGLSADQVGSVAGGPDAAGWTARQRALLRATDELCRQQVISDDTWAELEAHLDERGLIEVCLLAGHYTMLASTLSSLGVQPERARA